MAWVWFRPGSPDNLRPVSTQDMWTAFCSNTALFATMVRDVGVIWDLRKCCLRPCYDSPADWLSSPMRYGALQRILPLFLRRYVLHFETSIDRAVADFAANLSPGARVLDAGAGEGKYSRLFLRQQYCGVDLGVGDRQWNYGKLDTVADLLALPFADRCFDACINVVTLEHVRQPGCALHEIARVLKPGAKLLLVAPQEWEIHQAPNDYFRFTRFGLQHLLDDAGFTGIVINPVGGYFRLLSHRLLNGLQFFHPLLLLPAALFIVPPALIAPLFDRLDVDRNFTLGYIATAIRANKHS